MNFRIPAATALVALAALTASAYEETHLNEITAPLLDYVNSRVATIQGESSPTKADKKELAKLSALQKTLVKSQIRLKGDFAELLAAAKTSAGLGDAATPMQTSLDQGFALAGVSLEERVEFAQDHVALLSNAKHVAAVQASLDSVSASRSAANSATTVVKRATFLSKADASVTKALTKAAGYVVSDRGAEFLPPTRRRSGDLVDQRGGRVAIPRDAGTPLAGASIVIPNNVIQNPINITLSAGSDFVSGRDSPAGPALVVEPDGISVPGAIVDVPYHLPAGALATDLALFVKTPSIAPVIPVTLEGNGFLSATVQSLSTYQAGVAAPPPGQPGGSYHVIAMSSATSLDSGGQDSAGIVASLLDETMTFRVDHTASTTSPNVSLLLRRFIHDGVHHSDSAPPSLLGSVDFTWTAGATGRFSFTFNVPTGPSTNVQVQCQGVASNDGRVISFFGRGGTYEVCGVGVKASATPVTADLAGRWVAVETGVQFLNAGAEPFTTRRHDALRILTIAANGDVAFGASGARYETDVTYHTDQSDPTHTRTENVLADSGTETWTAVGARITGQSLHRFGWFDKDAGLLVSGYFDGTQQRASLMIASPQPASQDPSQILGLYHLAQTDVGATVGSPTTHDSTHDVTGAVGSLDVASPNSATLAIEATTRDVFALTGPPPVSSLSWTMATSSSAVAASSTPVTLVLDASGTHRVTTDERWFAFAGAGRYVLGMTRGEPTRLARGIALGMK